jgi:formate dehydrogenase iron-sulfur subunit
MRDISDGSSKQSLHLSRRNFLRAAGLGTAAMVVTGTELACSAVSARTEELATVLDLSQCIGCGACVEACSEINAHKHPEPEKPFPTMLPNRVKVEDWSEKRSTNDRLTPYNWLYIQTVTGEYRNKPFELHIPRRCLHCQNPPCANLCPWGAALRQSDGIVRINEDICLGGAKCRDVCPWHIPQRQTGVGLYLKLLPRLAGNGVMYKCDRCYDRLALGGVPACIEICPMQIQSIGPRSEMLAKAHRLAREMNGHVYGEQENGGTNTFYVSPVPFHVLNHHAQHGPGRPHLEPVQNSMAKAENLTWAVFAAPLAGIAAGLLTGAKALTMKGTSHE